MDSYENYKNIKKLPLYITWYTSKRKGINTVLGFKVTINGFSRTEKYLKIFPFKNYQNNETLKMAQHFMETDKKFIYFKNNRDKNGKKPGEITFDESIEYYRNKYKIDKFPIIINNNKIIGIDKVGLQFYFIRECSECKKHSNVSVQNFKKSLNGLCKKCLIKVNSSGRKYKYLYWYYLDEENKKLIFKGKLANNILVFNKNILAKNFDLDFKEVVNNYMEYFLYFIDNFIIVNNLNFKRNLDNKTFLKFRKKYSNGNYLIKEPKYKINQTNMEKYRLKIQRHLFNAKIQGFGINKSDGSKTVLLNEVEYVGIDNFRDHMWTQYTKDLDLPIGTTIKFKGEIYDYERNYHGSREIEKEGQAIKIIEILEVDTSTRLRTKLFK